MGYQKNIENYLLFLVQSFDVQFIKCIFVIPNYKVLSMPENWFSDSNLEVIAFDGDRPSCVAVTGYNPFYLFTTFFSITTQ